MLISRLPLLLLLVVLLGAPPSRQAAAAAAAAVAANGTRSEAARQQEAASVLARLRGLVLGSAGGQNFATGARQVHTLTAGGAPSSATSRQTSRLMLSGISEQQQDATVAALRKNFPTAEAAWRAPVVVAIKTHHFFGPYARVVPDCTLEGRPLKCEFVDRQHSDSADADMLWYHLPSSCGVRVNKDAPHQLAIAMSMEASTYYGCLEDAGFMDQFEVEMTYRLCSHLPTPYAPTTEALRGAFFQQPLAWRKLENAVAYINSNCGALNGRNDIVQQMMGQNRLPVHSWGACLKNKVAPSHHFEKIDIFRRYKFCIAIENSNTLDYVTEKIFHAFQAGCVPIYWGAPNIDDFVPAANSFVDYRKFGNPQKLMDHLVELAGDQQAWQAMHAWRTWPVERLNPGFRKLLAMVSGAPHSQCGLCQIAMRNRLDPRPMRGTHCMRNASWLALKASDGKEGSAWGPGSDDGLKVPLPFLRADLKPTPS